MATLPKSAEADCDDAATLYVDLHRCAVDCHARVAFHALGKPTTSEIRFVGRLFGLEIPDGMEEDWWDLP